MHGANEIIREATELPIEERALVIDSLLKTFNPPEPEIDRQWVALAQRRLGGNGPLPVDVDSRNQVRPLAPRERGSGLRSLLNREL